MEYNLATAHIVHGAYQPDLALVDHLAQYNAPVAKRLHGEQDIEQFPLSGSLAATRGDTQNVEADRPCLDQRFALGVDHRGLDSVKTAGQVTQRDG